METNLNINGLQIIVKGVYDVGSEIITLEHLIAESIEKGDEFGSVLMEIETLPKEHYAKYNWKIKGDYSTDDYEMIADENKSMAQFLEKLGYSQEDISSIASGGFEECLKRGGTLNLYSCDFKRDEYEYVCKVCQVDPFAVPAVAITFVKATPIVKVPYIATKMVRGVKTTETYKFKALNSEDARQWVINHLDCSSEWFVEELSDE